MNIPRHAVRFFHLKGTFALNVNEARCFNGI